MGDSSYSQLSEFNFEGQFLGFVSDKVGKLKYLELALVHPQDVVQQHDAIASFTIGEVQIKISKELRRSLASTLVPGDKIQVAGVSKLKQSTGELKLKAYRITPIAVSSERTMSAAKALPSQPKVKILLCQKSGCLKRGGRELCQALEAIVRDRGLQERVTIERTSCLKCCSSGPNLVFMPGKTYYSRIRPNAIVDLLEKHL